MQLTLNQIALATGGKQSGFCEIKGISTDTRTIKEGELYIALRGERFDGHDYIDKAFENGAAAVLTEKECNYPYVLVEDTGKALLSLAAYYRMLFNTAVIGITGSVGKTTTKEMVACVLEAKYKTLKTKGNLNNQIGLPMTLFGLDDSYQTAVIEMGMSGKGEISALSKTAKPDAAIITNIGYSHIEFFGSREAICQAKLEILDGMEEDAPLVLNADDDLLCKFSDEQRPLVFFGIDNPLCDVRGINLKENGESTTFEILYNNQSYIATVPTVGKHNVYDALAAFCVGIISFVPIDDIISALKNYVPSGMRQRIETRGEQTVIIDCYNASPTSMQASMGVLSSRDGRKIAVLGDMLELGEQGKALHANLADTAKENKIDLVLCLGDEMKNMKMRADEIGVNCVHFDNKPDLAVYLKENLMSGDNVLFKGSRGMALEEIIEEVWGK